VALFSHLASVPGNILVEFFDELHRVLRANKLLTGEGCRHTMNTEALLRKRVSRVGKPIIEGSKRLMTGVGPRAFGHQVEHVRRSDAVKEFGDEVSVHIFTATGEAAPQWGD